jgi:hypothetical protein
MKFSDGIHLPKPQVEISGRPREVLASLAFSRATLHRNIGRPQRTRNGRDSHGSVRKTSHRDERYFFFVGPRATSTKALSAGEICERLG